LSQGLKRFATPEIDDRHIEDILPLVELSLRTTCSKNMQITPFEIVHGFQEALPSLLRTEEMHSNMDTENYAVGLRNAINLLHTAVYQNLQESKEEMKRYHRWTVVHQC